MKPGVQKAQPDPTPLQKQTYNGHSDLRTAIVVITIERNIAQDVARNIPILGISYKQHLHFSLPGRIDSASQAFAISHQIRQELRDLCDKALRTSISLPPCLLLLQ